jgi:hypothetical protein
LGEEEDVKEVVIDTYAILAMAYGELGERAEEIMLRIRRGEMTPPRPRRAGFLCWGLGC